MQFYDIGGYKISPEDPRFHEALENAYAKHIRPQCLCTTEERLFLYIAKRGEKFVLARWPGSGGGHQPSCDHFEAPAFLDGLGEVQGHAIVDDKDTGETLLKFGFPLSKGQARAAPNAITNDKPVVKATVQRLTMRGMLHYLWERAQLTHWHPRMAGRRNWFVVRREINSALINCKARGEALSKVIFMPETFSVDRKEQISEHRRESLALAHASREAIMIVIGEIKGFRKTSFGEQIIIKHLPDWPFSMDHKMAKRFHSKFADEEALHHGAIDRTKMIVAASFAIGKSKFPEIFEVSIIVVTDQWLPVETLDELDLVDRAAKDGRRFTKGLRYNLDVDRRIASIVLQDTGNQPTAVYLEDSMPTSEQDQDLTEMLDAHGIRYVMWKPGGRLPQVQARQQGGYGMDKRQSPPEQAAHTGQREDRPDLFHGNRSREPIASASLQEDDARMDHGEEWTDPETGECFESSGNEQSPDPDDDGHKNQAEGHVASVPT